MQKYSTRLLYLFMIEIISETEFDKINCALILANKNFIIKIKLHFVIHTHILCPVQHSKSSAIEVIVT